jgi:RNA recognition motif-containing protein
MAASIPDIPKKRKRSSVDEPEIEIDLSLPEPLSKKALRKSKKQKPKDAEEPQPEDQQVPLTGSHGTATGEKTLEEETEHTKAVRTPWGVWIGNLPWTATKTQLRKFLVENASIADSQVTRLHMPMAPVPGETQDKPSKKNKGFAYVDFESDDILKAVLALSEKRMGDRAVLIKNAQNFEGRPVKVDRKEEVDSSNQLSKPSSKRIFVGNLGFEVTKDDLTEHFSQCGTVTDLHMATFEDSGKCKGFAWITFSTAMEATNAVRGWISVDGAESHADTASAEDEAAKEERRPKGKQRKKPVNRLNGRTLRCEFAEDPAVRYKKRFGKEARTDRDQANAAGLVEAGSDIVTKPHATSHERRREQRKAGKGRVDARTIQPGAANVNAQRSSAAIVEAKGNKITFD